MNTPYRWVIVAVGALVTCVAIGAMFSLAVFLGPMSASTGWGRATISTAMTLDFLVMGIAGFAWGAASDRFGARIVVLCGAVLLGAGLVLASLATSPLTFQLSFGAIVGIAAGAFFAPLTAAVTGWFDTQRALAVSLVSAGIGVAPMTVSPFAAWLFHVVSYAIACGVPTMAAVSIYSLEGLSGLGGRLLLGVAADRLGVKPILIGGLLIQSFAISGYLLASELNEFYLLSIVFGGAYGVVMPLYAVLARDYFEQRIIGAILGAATMLSSLGMAIGPVVGGWVFDTYHDYRWLYIGSVGLALAATGIALAFPKVPAANRELAVPG